MRKIVNKIFRFDNFTILTMLFSFSVVIFVPYGIRTFPLLGLILLSFFSISFFKDSGLESFGQLRKYKKSIIAFILVMFLSLFSFLPSSLGTLLIFLFLFLASTSRPEISRKFINIGMYFSLIVISIYTYMYWNRIDFFGEIINSNYLALQVFLFFICSVKFSFKIGHLSTIIITLLIGVRNLQLSLALYYVLQIPWIIRRISLNKIFLLTLLANVLLFSVGMYAENEVFNVPVWNKKKMSITFKEKKLNTFSSGRIELNTDFLKKSFKNPKEFLIGKGDHYQGNFFGRYKMPVHNSFLIIIARHGIIYLSIFLGLLYAFIAKFPSKKNLSILVVVFSFGSLLHGLLETYPLLFFISLFLIEEKK